MSHLRVDFRDFNKSFGDALEDGGDKVSVFSAECEMEGVADEDDDVPFEEPLIEWLLGDGALFEVCYVLDGVDWLGSGFDGIEAVCEDVDEGGEEGFGECFVGGGDGLFS